MVGCTGGGSSFGGFIFPFVPDKLSGERGTRFVAVEPTAAPSLTGGQYRTTSGTRRPPRRSSRCTPWATRSCRRRSPRTRCGSPSTRRCKEAGESKVIAINLCGYGHFDMQAYRSFLDGQLVNYEYPQERITEALAELPAVG